MFLFRFLDLPVFLVSLAIGFFIIYIYGSDMKVVYVYPTPENMQDILFQDDANNCFIYKAREERCPTDKSKIKEVPIQQVSGGNFINPSSF